MGIYKLPAAIVNNARGTTATTLSATIKCSDTVRAYTLSGVFKDFWANLPAVIILPSISPIPQWIVPIDQ